MHVHNSICVPVLAHLAALPRSGVCEKINSVDVHRGRTRERARQRHTLTSGTPCLQESATPIIHMHAHSHTYDACWELIGRSSRCILVRHSLVSRNTCDASPRTPALAPGHSQKVSRSTYSSGRVDRAWSRMITLHCTQQYKATASL